MIKTHTKNVSLGTGLLCIVVFATIAEPLQSEEVEKRADLNWWSLQPLQSVSIPVADGSTNPIDHFVYARHKINSVSASVPADRRTLIRRLSIDLTGLPPTLKEVEAFLGDTSEQAYEKLVDRLLASPHYGERWGRHWLDVVHFGESHGFEYNQPRNNAWHYRNWVIDAFNSDMPYDEFVRLQIAGDYIAPEKGGVTATGCLVAGPHNTTKPSNDPMRKTMRQDEMEDIIALVGQTFLGLTVNCARCHDHKFDPISIKDYYSMAAALSGVEFGERDIVTRESLAAKKIQNELNGRRRFLRNVLKGIEEKARQAAYSASLVRQEVKKAPGPAPCASWDFTKGLEDRVGAMHVALVGGARREKTGLILNGKEAFGRTAPLKKDVNEKTLECWVKLDDLRQKGGSAITLQTRNGVVFDAIVFAERETNRWMAGSNNYLRTKSFSAPADIEAAKRFVHVAIVYTKEGQIIGYRDGLRYGNAYKSHLQSYRATDTEVIFGLRHGNGADAGRMLKGTVSRANLYDRALTDTEIANSAANGGVIVREEDILAQMTPEVQKKRQELQMELADIEKKLSQFPSGKPKKTWAAKPIRPDTTHVLVRGSVMEKGDAVISRGLPAIKTLSPDFGLDANAPDRERRVNLANWITNPKNPLFSRVIVNRIWHYHFGSGIVATPNDFGYSGVKPTHPELLDWLAADFIKHQWSMKYLHRLIVTSATYRQSSKPNKEAMAQDAGNRFLWRKSPARMEGEVLRDSMLLLSGKLDFTLGGKGYRDMKEYRFKGSHFYDIIEQNNPEQFRRTIYRFSPRGAKRTMLDTFDCPDPSTITPSRAETTTPLQSLALMNNSFVLLMADAFAKRLEKEAGNLIDNQISLAYQLAYSRPATREEKELASLFIKEHGLPAFCRVIFNSNEMLYVR